MVKVCESNHYGKCYRPRSPYSGRDCVGFWECVHIQRLNKIEKKYKQQKKEK